MSNTDLMTKFGSMLDSYFLISKRGSSIGVEMRAGFSSFLTVAYILVVNPQILSGAGLPINSVTTSTALSSAIATFLTGVFANLPMVISPGMGLNAFLVFSQVLGLGVSLPQAFACCIVASVVVAVLAVLKALNIILALVPNTIKLATVVGMGLLLSLIGLQSAGVVVANEDTMVGLGDLATLNVALAVGGLALIASLHYNKVRGSILIGMTVTALSYFTILNKWPAKVFALPEIQFFPHDFSQIQAMNPSAISAIIAYTLVMVFDIGGAMFGLGKLAGIVSGNSVPGSIPLFLSAAAGTAFGALTGTTPLIIAAESAVGIKEGGRTGLVAVTASLCFLISLFLAPVIQALPPVTTAPVLVLVGAMMMGEAGHIDWTVMTSAVPAFLTMVIQPFTFSIANGIYAGLAFSVILFFFTGDFLVYFRNLSKPFPGEEMEEEHGDDDAHHEPLLSGGEHPRRISSPFNYTRMSHRITADIQDVISRSHYDRTPELLIGSSRQGSDALARSLPANSQTGFDIPRSSPPMYPPVPSGH
ncbi:hypothetical protein CEUSTIGMA_g356.t1 [Chlamydomonas eustigma]|uniref:Uncharacterized protein n=1 Tax=Chlamydomonas eustigma TaxID=1157962 RepID=A0A250WQ29_9CHLO|nr:hypothetical protein CEUSTIGMA_g356.t1 [Chlamydomonas eustigma]|eukprot:GAX72901.1 hypothetical protein CEUSTIGMA_g356.t1 [Chlamydomonas eustigma]